LHLDVHRSVPVSDERGSLTRLPRESTPLLWVSAYPPERPYVVRATCSKTPIQSSLFSNSPCLPRRLCMSCLTNDNSKYRRTGHPVRPIAPRAANPAQDSASWISIPRALSAQSRDQPTGTRRFHLRGPTELQSSLLRSGTLLVGHDNNGAMQPFKLITSTISALENHPPTPVLFVCFADPFNSHSISFSYPSSSATVPALQAISAYRL